MKILIIDDEQAIVKMYSSAFTSAGINMISASDGQNALELIESEKPDAVLLDIIMPKINGLDVLKKIKENETIKNIPVFLLTNLPEECSGEKAKSLGGAGYFVKAQTEPQQMVQIIQNYFLPCSNTK